MAKAEMSLEQAQEVLYLLKDGYEEIDSGREPEERCEGCGAHSLFYAIFAGESAVSEPETASVFWCRKDSCRWIAVRHDKL